MKAICQRPLANHIHSSLSISPHKFTTNRAVDEQRCYDYKIKLSNGGSQSSADVRGNKRASSHNKTSRRKERYCTPEDEATGARRSISYNLHHQCHLMYCSPTSLSASSTSIATRPSQEGTPVNVMGPSFSHSPYKSIISLATRWQHLTSYETLARMGAGQHQASFRPAFTL